jgi:hypothetical protein
MKNITKPTKIQNKAVAIAHKIMLVAMLHSSFIAPSQSLISAYINRVSPLHYLGSSLPNYNTSLNENQTKLIDNPYKQESKVDNASDAINNTLPQLGSNNTVIPFDIQHGIIGVSKQNPLDDPKDNLFKFSLITQPESKKRYFLSYELYGVQDNSAVSRSINDHFATGGYLVKQQQSWSSQKEELNPMWLRKGVNKIMFSIPKGAEYQYEVRNIKIEVQEVNENAILPLVVLNSLNTTYIKDNKMYVKGFLRSAITETTKVYIEDQPLILNGDEFEGFIILTPALKNRKFLVVKAIDSNGLLGQEIVPFDTLNEADSLFSIETVSNRVAKIFGTALSGELEGDGASLVIKENSLSETKEISITKLRNIDIAPLSSGMINVTKGGLGYRFLPDGITFKIPVLLKIAYDEKLLPKGYAVKDIKTFYFNTDSKSWVAVKRDTINEKEKTVSVLTTHFTDYINGIIQAPESPETAGFTSTMMNDIKAADPSSEMTIISPPEVSQKGDANVSYPIKIPAGRKGMQPQIALQYSSGGGNGWLGEGWNINIPSVSIDTRWGVPTFDPINESEIYSLGGEQLMYPKLSTGSDWMPNRHYDVAGSLSSVYTTLPRARIVAATFTPRKQGSFAKIERLGTSPNTYYWKVTNTDGSKNWYGGDAIGIKENTIIRKTQNALANNPDSPALVNGSEIVHWGLFMSEDVFGNNVIYQYRNESPTQFTGANENLNGGNIFHIKTIYYSGFKGTKGLYSIVFEEDTDVRNDVSINANLGVKQIEPYLLNKVVVKNNNAVVRSYGFTYITGKFEKTLLDKVTEFDTNNTEFYSHKFDYYDDVSLQDIKKTIVLFEEPVRIILPNPTSPNFTLGINQLFGSSKINTNQTFDYGWELHPSIGLEIRWKNISQEPYNTINFGLPFGKSFSKSNGIISMVDIDGNGLDDIVYRTNYGLRYFPHYFDVNTNQTSFGTEKKIIGIESFNKSSGTTQNKFLESWDLKFQLPWSNKRFHVGKRRFVSKNYTNIYFTDGNGDGLIDVVKDDKVVFNKGEITNGYIEFAPSSKETPNMLITAITNTIPAINTDDNITEEGTFDVVRVWVAPKSGTIEINDIIYLESEPNFTLDSNSKGVYSIETSNNSINPTSPFRLYFNELTVSNTLASVYISNYLGNNPPLGSNNSSSLTVIKGQRIYFRLKSNQQSSHYKINSKPKITYLNEPNLSILKDENLENHINSEYESAFILNGNMSFDIPENGSLTINWDNIAISNLSDNVKYEIIKTTSTPTIDGQDVEEIIFSKSFNSGVVSTLTTNNYDFGQNVSLPILINLGSSQNPNAVSISFKVTSDSNLKWSEIQWKPKIIFTPTTPSNGITQTIKYPVVEHSIYKSTFSKKIQPQTNWTTTNSVIDYGIKPITNIMLPVEFHNVIDLS